MSAPERLVDAYTLVVFDLDGVIYLIDRPIPGAVEAVGRLRSDGIALSFATNNASRRSSEVAALLDGMGVPAKPDEVLAGQLAAGSPVLVVGAEALRAELTAAGLSPVASADDGPAAVVQGYGPDVGWADLAEAAVAVRAGAVWVATNTDHTLPSPRGPLPGNGALVAALRTALNRDPDLVVGKPEPALFATAARRAGKGRALVVGDRLDTDIAGAVRAGLDSLLVLTGVSDAADLLAAAPPARPTYVAQDLGGLFDPDQVVQLTADGGGGTGAGPDDGWRVAVDGDALTLAGSGPTIAALGALCRVAWAGGPAARIRADGDAARFALTQLDLAG